MFIYFLGILFGSVLALVGLIATIVALGCIDPIDHIWSIPMLIVGIAFMWGSCNRMVEVRVSEELQQQQVVEEVNNEI